MSLEPGDRIGPYEILRLLGAGGMGEVYRGRDARLGRDVALKVISPRLAGDESFRSRFEREARAASALNHPSIVTVYDVGDLDGMSWIAMEWIDGRTLRQVLAQGPLPIDDAWSIARQLADGLAAAHAKGITHRDLKPENVMMTTDGRIRILDFGLALQSAPRGFESSLAAAETRTALGATVDGAILGTIGYMSPEQAAGGRVDFRSDQFALGLLTYEMLAGRRAFARASAVETLWATIREEPLPLSSFRSDVPDALRDLVARCLAKRPEHRFASTTEIGRTLETVGPVVDAPAPVTTAPPPDRSRFAASPWRIAGAAAGAAGIALVLALLVLMSKGFGGLPVAIDSLAVLPFENRSTDPDSNYLADEFTDSLITQMSRVPSLKVIARATAFRFKGASDLRTAGRDLDVKAILTGSVLRRGNELAISAELIDLKTGVRLWGDAYKAPFADLLRLQGTIVSEISGKLGLQLSEQEKRALNTQGTENPEAYDLFLRAGHLLLSDSEDDDLEARRLYQRAIAKDPRFVDASLGVASTYLRSATNGYAPPGVAWAKANEQLQNVSRLDPTNVGVRVRLAARQFFYDWNWPAAEREFRMLTDDPQILQDNRYWPVAIFFRARGWPDQAHKLLKRALRFDPANLESTIMVADLLADADRLENAVAYYRGIMAIHPADSRPLFGLADALLRKRDIPNAINTLRTAYALSGEEAGSAALAGARSQQDYEAAQAAVARARRSHLEELAKTRYVSPLDLARVNALAGDREQAVSYLELAVEERSPMVVLLKVDRAWDAVRGDARFAAIVRRVGIP